MYKHIFIVLLALAALQVGAGTIKKWVDERGVTHYGDSVPPEYVKQGSTEFNSMGTVVKKTERAITAEERKAQEEARLNQEAAKQKEMEQQRRDKALLNTYTSEKEIDLARDRNLQQAEVQSKSAELRIKQVEERLAKYRNQAAAATKAGKPLPADLKQDIANAENEIRHQKGAIQQKKKDIETVRAKFEADKVRYRELTQK
ncbi:MAG: DUF4124 domain-containing protein [Sulfuricellaceae bacterium]